MAVFKKIFTALRGGMNEMGEAVVDAQAIRILDQEIRDADQELKQAKESLASILAQQKIAEKAVAKTQAKIAEYEGYALKALEAEDETLALEVAEKISVLEEELTKQEQEASQFAQNVDRLRQTIIQTEANIRNIKQQVDMVKATESLQKAQQAVAQRYGNSTAKLQTSLDSLERIKARQEKAQATLEAKDELANDEQADELEKKLKAAGIKSNRQNASDILERLKQKKQSE